MFGVQSSENTDTSPVPSSQLADKEDEDWYPRKIQPLPHSLVITLCILGLWRPRRDATRKRRASSQEWPSCPQPLCPQEAAHFQAGRTRTNSTTELIGYPPSATNNNYGATETLHGVSSCSTTTDETDDKLGLDHMHCNICRDEFGTELSHESSGLSPLFCFTHFTPTRVNKKRLFALRHWTLLVLLKIIVSIKTYLVTSNGELLIV